MKETKIKELINKQFRNETETGAKLGLDDKYIAAFTEWLQLQKQYLVYYSSNPVYAASILDSLIGSLTYEASNSPVTTEVAKDGKQ